MDDNIIPSNDIPDPKPKKPRKETSARRPSAIYRLTPRHRSFVLALRRLAWNQSAAYMEAYPDSATSDVNTIASAASRLMNRKDIQESIKDIYRELSVKETETFERVLLRFVAEAEGATKASDRVQSNIQIAKLSRYMPSDSPQVAIFNALPDDLARIRARLEAKGKMMPSVNETINTDIHKSNDTIDIQQPSTCNLT